MKTKFTLLLLSMSMFLTSCGKNGNRTNDGDFNNQNIDSNGLDVNASLSAKLTRIEQAFPCGQGVTRRTIGFAVQGNGFNNVFLGKRNVSLNITNARGAYVGKTDFNDIVLVKELDNNLREIRVRACDLDRYGSQMTNPASADIVGNISTSNVTSCTVNQISSLNMYLTFNNGRQDLLFQVYPVNAEGPVNTVCPYDLFSDPAGFGGF